MIEPITALATAGVALYTGFAAVESASRGLDRMIENGMDVWTETQMLGLAHPLKLRSKGERTIIKAWNENLAAALKIDINRISNLTQREVEDTVILLAAVENWALKGWAGHPAMPGVLAEAAAVIEDWGYVERAQALQAIDLKVAAQARGGR